MKGMKESKVLAQCLTFLRLRRVFAWRNNTGAAVANKQIIHFGLVGSSDIIGLANDGRFIAIECKRENGGKLSDAQQQFLDKIRQHGGVALVVHSVAELEQGLQQEGVL